MNVTYIIGNGFDINIGLKTKYSDFYDYYKDIEYNGIENKDIEEIKEEIKKLKKNIRDHVDLWSDLEKRLGKYTENVSSSYVMEKLYDDIADRLTEYINEQILTIPESSDEARKTLLTDFASPEKYFKRTDKEEIEAFYRLFHSTATINVITLNYTPTIEKILGDNHSNIKLDRGYFNGLIPVFDDIYHIHHSSDNIDDSILLGVNDETQIKNEKLRKEQNIRERIIKPETNKMFKTGVDKDCERIINNTNLFVLFGASVGATDKKWWELINKRVLRSDDCRVLMFEFDPDFKEKRTIGEYERKTKLKLSSQKKMLENELNILHSRIYVIINSDMFSNIKKYIHILPDQQGSFTINYSNNNGEHVIGQNKKKFTTKWSKASDKSIYASSDAQDIDSIGLVRDLTDISKINLSSIDFSSRIRTPQIGECVVWKNIYGNYAITKIEEIKDDSRNDDIDELKCQYVIYK